MITNRLHGAAALAACLLLALQGTALATANTSTTPTHDAPSAWASPTHNATTNPVWEAQSEAASLNHSHDATSAWDNASTWDHPPALEQSQPDTLYSAEDTRGGRKVYLNPECRQYKPEQCALTKEVGPAQKPYCHNGNGIQKECNFDTSFLGDCPLPKKGSFVEAHTQTTACRASKTSGGHSPPKCGEACCTADLRGSFHTRRQLSQHLHFQPHNNTCQYFAYRWRDAIACLAGSKIVIAGDSIMRQLFGSGVALFRGQEVAVDYNKHAHGRYVVCEDADKLSFGSFLPYRYEVPLEDIHTLFRSPHADAQPEGCPHDASIEMDFMWAPKFDDLIRTLSTYHTSYGAATEQITYVVFAGFWEDQSYIPPAYLDMLDTIRAEASHLIVIGVPRERIWGWKSDNAQIRNWKMKEWVAARSEAMGGNVLYLDFEHLAKAEGAPVAVGSLNWHYQCFLDPAHLEEARWTHGSLAGSWHWSSAPDHILPSVWVDEEGGCADEMDATLWQLILNLICNRR